MPSAQPGTALGADRAPPQSCFREGQRRSRRQTSRHVDVSNLAGQPALSQKCTTSLNTQLALLCPCVFCDYLVFHRRGHVECAATSASASAARPRLRADHRALGVSSPCSNRLEAHATAAVGGAFFCQHHTSSRKCLRCCWLSRSPPDAVAWCSINRCICGLIRKGGRQDRVHLQWCVCVHTRTRVHVRNRGRRGVVGAAPMKARRGATLSTPHTAYSAGLCFLQCSRHRYTHIATITPGRGC